MKCKMSILRYALCAAMLFAVNCSDHEFNNPLDPANGGGEDGPGGNPSTTYTLTVSRSPAAGGSVTVNGSATSGTTTHNNGASVTVCATAANDYTFSGWSGASTSTSSCVSITMSQNRTLTANFQAQPQNANAVIITLRSWQTRAEDFWDNNLDPRIYFRVVTSLGTTNTSDFLNRDNVGQSWSGSVRGSAIAIPMTSGNLDIYAVVLEQDGISGDDDISPAQYLRVTLPRTVNTTMTGQSIGTSTTSQSRVTFDLEFVRR